jgi:hypothetical protein
VPCSLNLTTKQSKIKISLHPRSSQVFIQRFQSICNNNLQTLSFPFIRSLAFHLLFSKITMRVHSSFGSLYLTFRQRSEQNTSLLSTINGVRVWHSFTTLTWSAEGKVHKANTMEYILSYCMLRRSNSRTIKSKFSEVGVDVVCVGCENV